MPLFLLGVGTGSDFLSRPHVPSARARREITMLNDCAAFSGARDVMTLEWLRRLGVSKATLSGDPATFIFNRPVWRPEAGGPVMITVPPLRFWSSKRQLLNVRVRGRAMFKAIVALARNLSGQGHEVVVTCNDPADWPLARRLFADWPPGRLLCPQSPEEYFRLLSESRALVSGRLHTAVVALSLGIPFVLMDVDQRTRGFVDTYGLGDWSLTPSARGTAPRLAELTAAVLGGDAPGSWEVFTGRRDRMYARAMGLLGDALRLVR